ncbi:MAG: hypothetical protein NTW76_06885 [Corynebacteriales bacterium]|nr:hypothetical protein [Mycobacteriales bacterium]
MWSVEITGESTASPDALYARWADVGTWSEWNDDVARIEMAAAFAPGARAEMVFGDGSSLPFEIAWVEPGRGYEDLTEIPDAGVAVRVRHTAETDGDRTRITYRCEVTGADDDTCAAVGAGVSSDFGAVIDGLARVVEGR